MSLVFWGKTARIQKQEALYEPLLTTMAQVLPSLGTKNRVLGVCFRGPLSSHTFSLIFPPSFPFRPGSLSHRLSPLHLPPLSPLFRLPEDSDLGTPLI